MEIESVYNNVVDIIESYFRLDHLPFNIEVDTILYSFSNYMFEDISEIPFNYLKSLLENTDDYINVCKKDGNYLLPLSIEGEEIHMIVNVKFK